MFGFIRQRAYCQLLLALATGIVAGYHARIPAALLVDEHVLLLLCILAVTLVWWAWRREQTLAWIIPGFALVFITGFLSVSVAIQLPLNMQLRGFTQYDPQELTGKVVSIPKHQRGHTRFLFQVSQVGETTLKHPETCYAYLKADEPPELYMSDRISLYASLSEPDPPANRGEFNYRHYLLHRGTVVTAYCASAKSLDRLSETPPQPWHLASQLRSMLTANLEDAMPEDYAGLAVSVVYGDKITELPEDLEERFRSAGLTHILVASGTQVSLLMLLLGLMFWRFTGEFSWRGTLFSMLQFIVTLLAVLTYASITGFETSILRALAMGIMLMVGKLFHREGDGLSILAQSALILLVINPLSLFSPGFQLSFGATFGLIYLMGAFFPLINQLKGWRKWAAGTIATTGGAQLFVAPVLIAHFNQLSMWGLFSNIVAIPMAFLMLLVGAAVSFGFGTIPLLGTVIKSALHALCWALDHWAGFFASLPGSDMVIPTPPWWWLVTFYAAAILGLEIYKHHRREDYLPLWPYPVAGIAAALLLSGWVMHWLFVPQPQFKALALKKCEAYVWRPYTGQTLVIARSAGMTSSHNDEATANSLRSLGINNISDVYWIDSQGDSTVISRGMRSGGSVAGGSLPPNCDARWIFDGDDCCGALFGIRDKTVGLVWDCRGPVINALLQMPTAPEIVFLSPTTSTKLPSRELDELALKCTIATASTSYRGKHPGVMPSNAELTAVPGGSGISLCRSGPVSY